jgi:hypothetical protein
MFHAVLSQKCHPVSEISHPHAYHCRGFGPTCRHKETVTQCKGSSQLTFPPPFAFSAQHETARHRVRQLDQRPDTHDEKQDATPQPSHLLGPLQAADLTRTPVSRLHRNGGITNGSICGYTYSHKGSDMARSHSFLPRQSFHQQTDSQMPMPHAPAQGRKDRWHTPLHYKHSRL